MFYGTDRPISTPAKRITVKIVDVEVDLAGGYRGRCHWPSSLVDSVVLTLTRSGTSYTGKHTSRINGHSSEVEDLKVDQSTKKISFWIFGYFYSGTYDFGNTGLCLDLSCMQLGSRCIYCRD